MSEKGGSVMSKYSPRASTGFTSVPSKGRGSIVSSDYEEFASLQLDKPNEGELKTSEEMKRHMFDDHFEGRPIERAVHILAVGEEVQRLSVIRDLLVLLHTDEQGCLQRVVQKIHQGLNSASTEFHIETARSFSNILEKKAVAPSVFANNFLPSVIFHMDNRDQVVSNAWLETLLKSTELLPLEIVKTQILNIAINKGQISQNVFHRVAASKLLGKLCTRFDSHTVKKDLLPIILSLCQDVNEAVRACICSQLHLVAKGIPSDTIKPALIPTLVELGRDETPQVRVEATETIVKIMPSLSQEVLKVTIIPLIKKICEQAVLSVDDTLVMVAKQFGGICLGLENVLTQPEKLWMVNYYHNLSHLGIPSHGVKKDAFYTNYNMERLNSRYIECRQYCAYNFPAIAKFSSSSQELLEKIFPSFCDLSTDPFYMVRKTIGAGIHEVARILSPNNRIVKNQMITLLWDNMEEVLMGVVPNLSKTIDWLIASRVLGHEQDGVTFELGRGLLQCDKTIRDKTHNWRLYTDFITQLETVVKCLPSDYIYSHFVSLMFEKMHRARPLPCRLAAARTLLVFLRFNLKSNQRQEIRSRLQSEFCLSSSCYKRMLYLRLCNTARELFSKSYFKEHFFFPLLSRSEDKVANNRILLIRQFPYLKAMIIMPIEKKYLQTLESCVRSMAVAEKDRDVTFELKMSISRLEKTETLTEKPPTYVPEDPEDRKKYEEEVRIASITKGGIGYQPVAADSRKIQKDSKTPVANDGVPVRPNIPPPPPPPPVSGQGSKTVNPSSSSVAPKASSVTSGSHSNSPSTAPPRSSITSSTLSSSTSTASPRTDRQSPRVTYTPISSPQTVSGPRSSVQQGFSNTSDNLCPVRSLSTHLTNIDHSCTCFPTNYRSENLRNLNLLALIDTNLMNSKQKFSEAARQKLLEDPRLKMLKSAKHNMEMSWLNLETDIKNEVFALAKNRQIHGDRNFREKSKFLTDFRNYNESNLRKFISEDKSTIYNVTGVAGCHERNTNFFEDRINFFERKIKLEDQRPNSPGDCSCFELTSKKFFDEEKKFSYFSKNFEEDFYRDAGVKANDIIGRKFSHIPVQDTKSQVSTPKFSASATNKRRTWFGNENENQAVKLETITGYKSNSCERKKSETLPSSESVSLKRLGIGPRSKSFVLPSAHAFNEKAIEGPNGKESRSVENTDQNRFGFRAKKKPETKEKNTLKTKIPVGIGNGSPCGSRSSSPCLGKQSNGTKKIPVVVSRKSMVIQTSTSKAETARNRRSLDPSKNYTASLDKAQGLKRRGEKENGTSGTGEEKGDAEALSNGTLSKLPVRRPKP